MDYSLRKITSVDVWALERVKFSDEAPGVVGTVRVVVSDMDGEQHGPQVTIQIGAPTSENPTIKEAENALLEAAIGILKRLSAATPSELIVALQEERATKALPRVGAN